VSYWVVPEARGAAIATRATRRLSRWAFDALRLHRLFLVHSTENAAPCRVAALAGFGLEGTLRDYMLHTDGWHDVHMHGRVAR
jgi:RimJ/RimL family protein N-acetyltransferase